MPKLSPEQKQRYKKIKDEIDELDKDVKKMHKKIVLLQDEARRKNILKKIKSS